MFKPSSISGLSSCTVVFGPRAGSDTVAAGASGLMLRLRLGVEGELTYDIVLCWPDDRGERVLVGAACEEDAVARWRRMAADLGLKLVLEMPDGTPCELYDQLGLVHYGSRHERRRCWALTKRRPFFLRRRKVARLPDRPVMVRGQEIPRGHETPRGQDVPRL